MNDETPVSKADFEAMLIDVRHSWRVVAAFQQRIFFLLRQIEASFPELTHSYWAPTWTQRPPKGGTKPWSRWTWDFLPFYATDNWFTLAGKTSRTKLTLGDWFVLVRIFSDEGFDRDGEQSASFSGPDPMKMDPAEQTDTMLHFLVYHVTGSAGVGRTPHEIHDADDTEGEENLIWEEIPEIGARTMLAGGSLAELLQEGAVEALISDLRKRLIEDGLSLQPMLRP